LNIKYTVRCAIELEIQFCFNDHNRSLLKESFIGYLLRIIQNGELCSRHKIYTEIVSFQS
jgi:hypothetical protein